MKKFLVLSVFILLLGIPLIAQQNGYFIDEGEFNSMLQQFQQYSIIGDVELESTSDKNIFVILQYEDEVGIVVLIKYTMFNTTVTVYKSKSSSWNSQVPIQEIARTMIMIEPGAGVKLFKYVPR